MQKMNQAKIQPNIDQNKILENRKKSGIKETAADFNTKRTIEPDQACETVPLKAPSGFLLNGKRSIVHATGQPYTPKRGDQDGQKIVNACGFQV
jgi:hypothetical protein